ARCIAYRHACRSAVRARARRHRHPMLPREPRVLTRASLSGQAAIVGASTAAIGWETNQGVAEIMADAAHSALADAGLTVRAVDGLFAVTPYFWMPSVTLADQLGIEPPGTRATKLRGSRVVAHVGHAVRAIALGQCEVA